MAKPALYKATIASFRVMPFSAFGQSSLEDKKMQITVKTTVIMIPATIPPLKRSPMELEVMVPYTTIMIEGGMIGPKPPATANKPAERCCG